VLPKKKLVAVLVAVLLVVILVVIADMSMLFLATD
jgi:hypothetical protein